MSKITDDGLTWSGTQDTLCLYPYGNSGCQRVNYFSQWHSQWDTGKC